MSRSAGFIAEENGKEVFSVCWKNYLNVDTTIIMYAYQHNLAKIIKDIDENFEMVYADFDAFHQTYHYLRETLTSTYWDTNDAMQHDKNEAIIQWCNILSTIDHFLKTIYEGELKIKFFECN